MSRFNNHSITHFFFEYLLFSPISLNLGGMKLQVELFEPGGDEVGLSAYGYQYGESHDSALRFNTFRKQVAVSSYPMAE